MAHPLDGALAHVDRADRDFGELEQTIAAFIQAHKRNPFSDNYAAFSTKGLHSLEPSGTLNLGLPALDLSAAVAVSGIIHHLRAALDYLIYELALHDSKVSQEKTQFIIADAKADIKADANNPRGKRGFDSRAKKELVGLSASHVAMVEDLQPYKGVKWTADLRDISNPDKHRKLTAISPFRRTDYRITVGDVPGLENRPHRTLRSLSSDRKINIEADVSVHVVFPEWNNVPVIETLDVLKGKVRATIDAFKPEFE